MANNCGCPIFLFQKEGIRWKCDLIIKEDASKTCNFKPGNEQKKDTIFSSVSIANISKTYNLKAQEM